MLSPSGLLTDGPLGRRPVVSASPLRDRSASPIYDGTQLNGRNTNKNFYQTSSQNNGSNSSLHTIQESKIPSSPMLNRKQPIGRKSFLPQPVSYANNMQHQQNQQFSHQRQSSSSPIR